jgi:N-acetylglucosaminyl-diphospho-decaprenol L-rhamnosyltransferase
MILQAKVVILIVGFRNANDIKCRLRALSRAQPNPTFEVFIAENGGREATDAIIDI